MSQNYNEKQKDDKQNSEDRLSLRAQGKRLD